MMASVVPLPPPPQVAEWRLKDLEEQLRERGRFCEFLYDHYHIDAAEAWAAFMDAERQQKQLQHRRCTKRRKRSLQ
jgi:hypothetical protein